MKSSADGSMMSKASDFNKEHQMQPPEGSDYEDQLEETHIEDSRPDLSDKIEMVQKKSPNLKQQPIFDECCQPKSRDQES